VSARPVRLIQISDTHLFADPAGEFDRVNTLDSLRRVLALARTTDWPVDAVLATGDLAQDGSREAYAALHGCLAELEVPVYCLAGNHDDPTRMAEVLSTGDVHLTDAALLGGWQVLFLNTHVPGHEGGRLGAAQLERFRSRLERASGRHVLVCLHHHPVPSGSRWLDRIGLADAADLFAVVDRFPQVHAIVWGHIHQAFEIERRGVQLLAAPSTCVQFRPGAERYTRDELTPGYRRLELRPDREIVTEVRRVEPTLTARAASRGRASGRRPRA